jgi:subtilisin family serine protease
MSDKTKTFSSIAISYLLLSGLLFQLSSLKAPTEYSANGPTLVTSEEVRLVSLQSESISKSVGKQYSEPSDSGVVGHPELPDNPGIDKTLTAEDVARSSKETVFTTMTTQSGVTWGLDRADGTMDGQYTYVSSGTGVKIYIVDTGVDYAHPDLAGKVLDGFDSFGQNLDKTDCNGHGTHVAAIASGNYYGVAKESKIVPVRVLDCSGRGNTTTLALGINWILENHSGGIGIVNMSLGGPRDLEVNNLVSELVSSGLVVVAAAGNSNSDACNFSPASAPGVIAVGAVDRGDVMASFSNWGTCVDISAPGVFINSANSKDYGISSRKSGTSQASPFVAGAIATYISNGSVSNSFGAESYARSLSTNGVISVEVAEAPEDAPVESEPLPSEPEIIPGPEQVVEPVPESPETIAPKNPVYVTQHLERRNVGLLEWSLVEGASQYRVYVSSSVRPGFRLVWVAEEGWSYRTVVHKPGVIAIYRVMAIINSSEVLVGEFKYEPKD